MADMIIWHVGEDQRIKGFCVIHVPHMCCLVQNNRIDGILRILHQTVRKAEMYASVGIFLQEPKRFCAAV